MIKKEILDACQGVMPSKANNYSGLIYDLDEIAQEMTRIYFSNERDMEKYCDCDKYGFDNIHGNLCTYDIEYFFSVDDKQNAKDYLDDAKSYLQSIVDYADSKGYGAGAMQRGFDVTKPLGLYWTKGRNAIKIIDKLLNLL